MIYFLEMALAYMEQTKQRDGLEEMLLNLKNGKFFLQLECTKLSQLIGIKVYIIIL